MTDYNDGKWHGWNGGECPVHPESVVDVIHAENGQLNCPRRACINSWDSPNLVAFRVITPYVEPVAYRGTCWAYHYTNLEPSLASHNAGGDCIHGRYTAMHENGKLKSITWEADE